MGFKVLFKNTWYAHAYKKGKVNPHIVLLESVNGKELGNNILRILEELCRPEYAEYELWFSCNENIRERARKLLDTYGLQRVKIVTCNSFQYYTLLGTAGYLVNDSTFPRRFIKKPGQVYVNTWHGTPLKRMGRDVPGGAHVIGNIQRNLFMTDYLCLPNPYTKDIFRDAYNLRGLYQGEYVYAGYPRNQAFFDRERQREVRRKVLHLEDSVRLYCYMPTWRGAGAVQTEQDKVQQAETLKRYLDELDQKLDDQEVLMLRLHPFVGPLISCESYRHIRYMPEELDPYEACAAADCLVTDYSSVFYDYACRPEGKIVLFLFEREQYQAERSIYGRIEDLPFPAAENLEDLLLELRSPKSYDDREFLETYCAEEGPDSAHRICELVFRGRREQPRVILEREPTDERKKLLFYVGGLKRNGITSAYLNLMGQLDPAQYSCYAAFQEEYLREEPSRVDLLPEQVRIQAMSPGWFLTFSEAAACYLRYKKSWDGRWVRAHVDEFYRREYQRNFGFLPLDAVIHYTGYERKIIDMFRQAPVHRGIFIHSNMEQEMARRTDQNRLTLAQAYREYDFAAAVSRTAYESARSIAQEDRRLRLVSNCIDCESVLKKAEAPLLFGPETRSNRSEQELQEIAQDARQGKPHPRRFITVGRFSKEKNHTLLIEAFARYQEKYPDAELVIIGGTGDLYEAAEQRAAELHVERQVLLVRNIDNPMALMKACDLFLLPSSYEGQPMVLTEADLLHVPCAGSRVPGIQEFMEEHGGYLFPLNIEGILSAMEAFDRGEIAPMEINFHAWNERAVQDFAACISQ